MNALPDLIGVYGGGRMGAGIAHAFLVAGTRVVVVETDDAAVAAARARVTTSVGKADSLGLLNEDPARTLARLEVTTSPAQLAGAGLVVEAVPEDVPLKQKVLGIVEQSAPDAVIATNTSSLPIDRLASPLSRPQRFLGLHFFNPVPASDLVEIVTGAATDVSVLARAQSWISDLGKSAITVRDSPGFASSRLGVGLALEAIRMVEEGVASAADVDLAMTLGYRHPTGPLRTTDIVGLDVRLAIAEHLERELGARFAPPDLLRRMVAEGKLGRKAGEGFYLW
ncbi:3-hydroxyacyl-CoA dehydrogenase family protein [Aeromicrobium panaciterrae]|uniref:3-hydroxyacyl-CoA dehydrogenase family protein n=1 Tax=Aeromicrobium panaciterrae TaxID=363861 RepID=UPI0031DC6A13